MLSRDAGCADDSLSARTDTGLSFPGLATKNKRHATDAVATAPMPVKIQARARRQLTDANRDSQFPAASRGMSVSRSARCMTAAANSDGTVRRGSSWSNSESR